MTRFARRSAVIAVALLAIEFSAVTAASARGGADFMNSPGYQRRLQESRGYVTNQSGSLLSSAPPAQPVPAAPVRKRRHRH